MLTSNRQSKRFNQVETLFQRIIQEEGYSGAVYLAGSDHYIVFVVHPKNKDDGTRPVYKQLYSGRVYSSIDDVVREVTEDLLNVIG